MFLELTFLLLYFAMMIEDKWIFLVIPEGKEKASEFDVEVCISEVLTKQLLPRTFSNF